MAFALYHSLMETFKSILSPEFGSEYELLNTELSIQSLRVRLWGDSVGLNVDSPGELHHDHGTTIVQVLNSITYLLKEIEEIRQKYQPKSIESNDSSKSEDSKESKPDASKDVLSKSPSRLLSLQQRMRVNRNEKSIVAITRWALRDARKFDEKVKRLKGLVDGLEDISRAAGPTLVNTPEDNPPPYSEASITAQTLPQTARCSTSHSRPPTPTIPLDILEQHAVMQRFLAAIPICRDYSALKIREKLLKLSEHQFRELGEDVYDEILRRKDWTASQYLAPIESYHPKRNEARKKLSTLLPSRFGNFVTHVMYELERRVPDIKDHVVRVPLVVFPSVINNPFKSQRWGCSPMSPPPLLQYRAAHPTIKTSRLGKEEISPDRDSYEIFKSLRVNKENSTRDVLPHAVKKFHIDAPWQRYALYVYHGNEERRLGMDEIPLRVFKQLKMEGKNPHFMLRKLSSAMSEQRSFDDSQKEV